MNKDVLVSGDLEWFWADGKVRRNYFLLVVPFL